MVNKVSFKNRQECKTCIMSNKHVVIKVSAGWCGPCKRISSLVEASLEELPSNTVVIVVNTVAIVGEKMVLYLVHLDTE